MRNYLKARVAPVLGIIALVAVIGISMTGCPIEAEDTGDNPKNTTEASPYTLPLGSWYNGRINTEDDKAWFSFPVTAGDKYLVYQQDHYNSGKTMDISVSAKYEGDSSWIFGTTTYGLENSPKEDASAFAIIPASQDGTVVLLVQEALVSFYNTGTFGIKVERQVDPLGSITNPIPMTAGDWEDWDLEFRTDELWFSFSVTAGMVYNVFWDDYAAGDGSSTADIRVSAKYQGASSDIFTNVDSAYTSGRSFTATGNTTTVLLRVISWASAGTIPGSFAIVYTIGNGIMPSIVLAD